MWTTALPRRYVFIGGHVPFLCFCLESKCCDLQRMPISGKSLTNLPTLAPRLPSQLVVTTLESKFRMYDMRTQHSTSGFAYLSEKAHKSTVWLAKHLPQNRDLFMTGGGNGGFNLYKYHYPNCRVKQDKVRMMSRVPRCASLVSPYHYHHPEENATQPCPRAGFPIKWA